MIQFQIMEFLYFLHFYLSLEIFFCFLFFFVLVSHRETNHWRWTVIGIVAFLCEWRLKFTQMCFKTCIGIRVLIWAQHAS